MRGARPASAGHRHPRSGQSVVVSGSWRRRASRATAAEHLPQHDGQALTVRRIDEHRDAGQGAARRAPGMVRVTMHADRPCQLRQGVARARSWPSRSGLGIVRTRSRSTDDFCSSRMRSAKTRPSGTATTSRNGRVGAASSLSPGPAGLTLRRPRAGPPAGPCPGRALVGRLADEPVAGPAGELGADDDLRPHPHGAPRRRRAAAARANGDARRRAGRAPPAARRGCPREPGADLAGVSQRTVLVDADEQRAELDRRAGTARPAADDELLLRPDLDLLPGHRALAGQVRRAAILGHDPFEPARSGRLEEGDPLARTCSLSRTRGSGRSDLGEQPAALLEGLVERASGRRGRAGRRPRTRTGVGGRARPRPLIRAWSRAKSGSPRSSSAMTSPSTIACRRRSRSAASRKPEVALGILLAPGPDPDRRRRRRPPRRGSRPT